MSKYNPDTDAYIKNVIYELKEFWIAMARK